MGISSDLDRRQQRAGRNQSLFREVNERINQLAGSKSTIGEFELPKHVDFICECIAEQCTEMVRLTLKEYESIRSVGNHFFVIAGHELAEVERVVREGDGYLVVEKIGAAKPLAERLNPRSRS